jgi:transposase
VCTQSSCPVCGQRSTRPHSRYQRRLQDLPWGQRRVELRVEVHRFFCENPFCVRQIFTERVSDMAEPSARRTTRLREAMLASGWALGGQAGARHCATHAMPVSGTTLLALLRRFGSITLPTPRVLGVDDWSFQARRAGTLLVDLEQHRPVDLLFGSDEQVLTNWLLTHPGVHVISRDRGASYHRGATKGAPQAQQVLDRWHVLKNLGDVFQKVLAQQTDVLQQAAYEIRATELPMPTTFTAPSRKPPRRVPAPPRKQRAWQLHMYEEVHRLSAEGCSLQAIVDQLHLNRHTVRKYQRQEHFTDYRHNPHRSSVEPYRAYLQKRWSQGCTMVTTLWKEIAAQGFPGSYRSVCHFTRDWIRPEAGASASVLRKATQQPRTPWQAKWLLLSEPEDLTTWDADYREAVCRLAPSLAEAASHVKRFLCMVGERKSDQLQAWLDQAKSSPLQELHRFALGLEKEYSAMSAALTEPWSTGQVEGQITRLKYLKRQMYGRAKIDLLRLRVLHRV